VEYFKKYWAWFVAGGFAVYWFFTGDNPIMILTALVGRGKRLATLTQDSDGNGIESVDDMVGQMVANAGRTMDPVACLLATVTASEHAAAGQKEKALIQRVIMNMAYQRGVSIESQITSGKGLGRQDGGRYVSSVNGAWEDDLATAEGNLNGSLPDNSGGALHFVHKTGFATLTDYEYVCAKWYAESKIVPVDVGGVSSLRIFLPESQVENG
jgi:hypothetical protein